MQKPEGFFFLTWGIATLIASLIVTYLAFVVKVHFAGVFWALVPVLGLTVSFVLMRHYKGRHLLFGAYKRSVAALWMFVGPGIGLVGFDSPTPLVSKLVVLGIGIAVTGRLLRHRTTLFVGVLASFSSVALYHLPILYQPIAFGVVTLVAMSIPALIFIFSPATQSVGEQSVAQDA